MCFGMDGFSKLFGFNLFFFSLLFVVLASCASVKTPPGGPKDTTPPQVDLLRSTPNMQTYFSERSLILTFDEWISTGDAFSQIVISPPLTYPYELQTKGKSIQFSFDPKEALRENATYTINFGDYVRDYTAGNTAENLRFLFSTGAVIDSLTFSGFVEDAYTQKPVADVLVMLYDEVADSVVHRQKPFFFSKTNQEGQFEINNIREGTYKLFVLSDQNRNYLYDLPTEEIGFSDSLVLINKPEGTILAQPIKLFAEALPFRLLDFDTRTFGKLALRFSRPPVGLSYQASPAFETHFSEIKDDSLLIWYIPRVEADSLQQVYLRDSVNNILDTLAFRMNQRTLEQSSLQPDLQPGGVKHHPDKSYELTFKRPVRDIDAGKIRWWADSIEQVIPLLIFRDTLNERNVRIHPAWKEQQTYFFSFLPGAFTDIFGQTNDSLDFSIMIDERAAYGTLQVNLKTLPPSPNYLVYLLDNAGKKKDVKKIGPLDQKALVFEMLRPGNYFLEIVADFNQNGVWDTGNYHARKQPEPVLKQPVPEIRANWDLEIDINWIQ